MRKLNTILPPLWEKIHKLVHLIERENKDWEKDKGLIFEWPTQDILTIICESEGKFLIGKFTGNYSYCPGDWDFLTKHYKKGCPSYKELSQKLPEELAGVKFVQHIRAYHSFHWLDLDERLWWHFIPYHVIIKGNPQIQENSKYEEFKLIHREDIPSFDRQGYLEYFAKRTLDIQDLYVDDFTTKFDKERGYYCFLPHKK